MLRVSAHFLSWLGWSLAVVWLLLPTSRALESAGTAPGTPLAGWEVLSMILDHTFNFWFWLYLIAAPGAQWLLVMGLATLLLLAMAPVVALADDRAGILQVPLGAVPLALLSLPPHLQHSLSWGIGVWLAAFLVFSAGGIARCLCAARSPASQ
jgi:hypothetical protein